MRILFLTTVLPSERLTGSEVVSDAFVTGLRRDGHDVTVLGYCRAGRQPPLASGDVAAGVRPIESHDARRRAAAWMGRAIVSGQPYSSAKYVSRAYRRAAHAQLDEGGPQLVVLDHAQLGWLEPHRWPVPHVVLAHNAEHRLYAELAAAGGPRAPLHRREARVIRAVEARLIRSARSTWALTPEDATALGELGAADTRVFDVPPAPAPTPGPPSCDVVLLGTWTWSPNALGLRWFLDTVLPQLPPGLQIDIGGGGAQDVVAERAGVRVRGRVPDAMAFLQSGRVVAVPSVAGSGVQVKTLDAIASGRPVVATPVAMRGIREPPASLRVTAGAAGFAAELLEALAGGRGEPAADGRGWAQRRADRFTDQLRSALAHAAGEDA